jgi:hypothetical protein
MAIIAPMFVLAIPVVGRTDEPAKQQTHSRNDIDYKKLREELREKGLIIYDEDKKAVKELQSKIQEEIKSLGKHPWAGEYCSGDGLHNNYMSLAPRAGFLFLYQGDIGASYANHGAVEQRDGKLYLSVSPPLERNNFYDALSDTFVCVAWGKRKYLIPADKLVDFCNQVNSGREPRDEAHGFCLLRKGDEMKGIAGNPDVPQEVAPYLLAKPIEAEIIDIGEPVKTEGGVSKVVLRVTLDHGKKSGILPGMKFHVVSPANLFEDITITSVGEERSDGAITRYYPFGVLPSLIQYSLESHPKVGWKVSTRRNKL